MPAEHSAQIGGDGSVVFGGGGTPYRDFPMHWYTGLDDDGAAGSYTPCATPGPDRPGTTSGAATSLETPAGVGHGLSGRFARWWVSSSTCTTTAPPRPRLRPRRPLRGSTPLRPAGPGAVLTVDVPDSAARTTFLVST